MRFNKYLLLKSHLDLARSYYCDLLEDNDVIIDATCGNGHDTLYLAQTCPTATIYALDILPIAIELTKAHLQENLPQERLKNIHLVNSCHSNFPEVIPPSSVKLIVYNLGYLPGFGNKKLTTMVKTTVNSLQKALTLIKKGGAISVSLYPGHEEGKNESDALIEMSKDLDPKHWNVCHHQWINRQKAPSLLFIQKSL